MTALARRAISARLRACVVAASFTMLFAAAIDIPERGQAEQRSTTALAALSTTAAPPVKGNTAATDWSNAFADVAEAVRPAVVFIRADVTEAPKSERRRLIPSPFDDFFDLAARLVD